MQVPGWILESVPCNTCTKGHQAHTREHNRQWAAIHVQVGGGQHTTLLESASVVSSRFCTKCGEPAGTNSSSPGCRVHTLVCAMANRGWSLTALSRSVQATQRVRTGSSRLVCGWSAPAGLMSNVGSSPCACVHRGYSNGICLRLKNVHLCSEGTR